MRLSAKKTIPYLVVIIPLVLVLSASFFITTFYFNKVKTYFTSAKERSVNERVELKKSESKLYSKQINLLFNYKYNRVEEEIRGELEARIDIAYKSARFIYEKYKGKRSSANIKERIVDALSHMRYKGSKEYVFVTDFSGNSILLGNQDIKKSNFASYLDAQNRSLILEEIQAVQKHQQSFLKSTNPTTHKQELILVKNLQAYDWFVGSVICFDDKIVLLKQRLLDMVKSLPINNAAFLVLYEGKTPIYSSIQEDSGLNEKELEAIRNSINDKHEWHTKELDGYYYINSYFEPLNWHLVHGFKTSTLTKKDQKVQKDLEILLDEELNFIVKASAGIVLFVTLLSLLLSMKINQIFKQYQNEVEEKREALEELNNSLEKRVAKEIKIHTQKEKMLIQSSKMAEMGDMLSMIAHQWRQPLNQLSYIFMNIESAYEYKELTKEYLEQKVKEGTTQLEFMSTTIDDFRNYFKPDKAKEELLVSDLVRSSVELMKHTLELEQITVELKTFGDDTTLVYKNEFIQVLLNLIKNAKDVLISKEIKDPKIVISSYCEVGSCVVEVCDNGGGISFDIIDKIFDPYFSTKSEKNGTGLGLYMSKMIIEEHHAGRLSATNSKSGVCFKIEI